MKVNHAQAIVSVTGEVDPATAPTLGGIIDALADHGATELIVDLGALTFMDAAGLRVLTAASNRLARANGEFVLRAVPPIVERILHVTGLDQTIAIEASALAAHRGPEPVDVSVPRASRTIDDALDLVAALAATTVDGAAGASVTLQRNGRLMTVASTDETMLRLDHHQYDTGQGPCVAAATEGIGFYLASVAAEDRWPAFVPHASDEGVAAILSTPLISGSRPVGAINIYSNVDEAFGTSEIHVAELLAAQASGIVADNDGASEHRRRTTDALVERDIIARAQGVLMGRHHIGARQAEKALHQGARFTERTVHAEARWVVASVSAASGDDDGVPGP